MSNTSPTPSHSDRIAWLRRINSVVSQWAASMSWMRLFALALIVLIASAWIGDPLHLKHEKLPRTRVEFAADAGRDGGQTADESVEFAGGIEGDAHVAREKRHPAGFVHEREGIRARDR